MKTEAPSQVYNLGSLSRVPPGEGRLFHVDGISVAVFHTRTGKAFATQAQCPHRGGPLADAIVGADKVICPLHGYKFDLATGQSTGGECPPLETYSVFVSERGEILLSLEGGFPWHLQRGSLSPPGG